MAYKLRSVLTVEHSICHYHARNGSYEHGAQYAGPDKHARQHTNGLHWKPVLQKSYSDSCVHGLRQVMNQWVSKSKKAKFVVDVNPNMY